MADDAAGCLLTMKEIVLAAKPYSFTKAQQRSRRLLLEALPSLPEDVAARIAQASENVRQDLANRGTLKRAAKAARKSSWKKSKRHKSLALNMDTSHDTQAVSRSESDSEDSSISEAAPGHDRSNERDLDHFLELPTTDEVRQLHRDFLAATSNAALARQVCTSCGRRLMEKELTKHDFLTLPNKHLLRPQTPHPAHTLTHRMLLESQFLEATHDSMLGWICQHCLSALKRNRMPVYSLANGMWIRPIPSVLSSLTIPEQLLVSLYYPRGYVFKLYPRGRGSDHPESLQSGLRGNVTTYMANVDAVAKMLAGQLMPCTLGILPSLIAVAFVGRSKLSRSWLKSLFRVRQRLIYASLLELKEVTHHPGYANLEISQDVLSTMPEDDIPNEILHILRVEPDEEVVEHESAGYVPADLSTHGTTCVEYGANGPDGSGAYDEESTTSLERSVSPIAESELETMVELEDGDSSEDIVPLEYTGAAAGDSLHITPEELMKSAIANLQEQMKSSMLQEGGYAIRHGGFARDFGAPRPGVSESGNQEENPSCYAFPFLFPYALGGLEAKKKVPVSFAEHTRWCLQYHDGRFRKHPTFPFWSFSIQQKRQALAASKLIMHRRDFDKVSLVLSTLTADDLEQARVEEEQQKPISNPKIILLRQFVQVTMQHVMGSDAARALNRSKLWNTSLYLNPMSLWITINPTDRHDPICQVFAGENIDMDNFNPMSGPSALQRAQNVANDPFAAAQFFFFLAETILETLFGFNVKGRTSENRMGALGLGNAYFGAVEAQGRGSLHLHMMMWLRNSPNAEEIVEKLKLPAFRGKIKTYIQTNLRSHIDSLNQAVLDSMEPNPALAWSRPPNPDSTTYANDLALLEIRLAKAQQYHRCSPSTCLRFNHQTKKMTCKRRAPFELSPDDEVSESGEIKTKRTVAYLNTWNPTVFYGGRCNNDIKFITNGSEARNLGFYITNYATKKQGKSYNQSALLAKTYMFHNSPGQTHLNSQQSNSSFLFCCGIAINREQEFSGQQVMSYLMGWGDTVQSHTYSPIYWSSVTRELKELFLELKSSEDIEGRQKIRKRSAQVDIPESSGKPNQDECVNNDSTENTNTTNRQQIAVAPDGTLYLRSQIVDYQYRGAELESCNFIDYFVNTYEESLPKDEPTFIGTRGRPQNIRVPYLPLHPRSNSSQRVIRSQGHRNLPNVIGKWFERNDDPDTHNFYCASVLACLKPWRNLSELKGECQSWQNALSEFKEAANDHQQCIMANMQYYYQCRDAAESDTMDNDQGHGDTRRGFLETEDIEMGEVINDVDLSEVLLSPSKRAQMAHAEEAVTIGRRLGMFEEHNTDSSSTWRPKPQTVSLASEEHYAKIYQWADALHKMNVRNNGPDPETKITTPDLGDTTQLDFLALASADTATIEYTGDVLVENRCDPDVSTLSLEQLRAYEIFKDHLDRRTNGEDVPQLLMHIQGEGGTGKSRVIAKITELLQVRCRQHTLLKGAFTGIAASLIEGSTLHKLATLHISTPRLSQEKVDQLRETWKDIEYLIIDEVSMVSKDSLGSLSERISIAKQPAGVNNNSVPFGGVNIILAGDFHQFPPVTGRGKAKGALYAPVAAGHQVNSVAGQWLYSRFTTVVILRKQFRNEDPKWRGILTRSRKGQCTPEDLKAIRSLIPKKNEQLFKHPPWTDAVLVTPRRAVRDRWNEEASRSYCLRTSNRLVVSRAADYHRNQPVSQQIATEIRSPKRKKCSARNDPGGLPEIVYLAKGMPVLVTTNVETEIDVANGSRAIIEEIIVHNDERDIDGHSLELHLKRPPACVLIRLIRTRATAIEGLEQGVIPIVPTYGSFRIPHNGKEISIRREQIPLIPAYAFTDYRAQGQTLPYVIIDIGKPPTGGLTPFNAYVALSRSMSMSQCRLLRDFDDTLFINPPSSLLLAEDERLEKLDKSTETEHAQRKQMKCRTDLTAGGL